MLQVFIDKEFTFIMVVIYLMPCLNLTCLLQEGDAFMSLMSRSRWRWPSEFKGKWQAWQRTRNYLLTELGQEFRVPHAKFRASLRTFTCPLKLLWWTVQFINYMSPSGNLLYLDKSWGTQNDPQALPLSHIVSNRFLHCAWALVSSPFLR